MSHLSRVVSAKCLCCKLVNDEGIPNDPITAVIDADCSLDVRFLKFLAETLHQIKLQHVGYQAVDTTSPPTISITLIYDFEPKMFHENGWNLFHQIRLASGFLMQLREKLTWLVFENWAVFSNSNLLQLV